MKDKKVLIIGGGYAGLAAGIELDRLKISSRIIEKENFIGGLSRTLELDGVKFELGPHIYFNQDKIVTKFWKELLGDNLVTYNRNNRIFYNGKFIQSPLKVFNAFIKIGPIAVFKMILSFLNSKFLKRPIESAEDWVIVNFGKELYKHFFKVYNEKIWGIDCNQISPNWAGQRIKSSLSTMVIKSFRKDEDFTIKTFDFPKGGSEMLYKKQLEVINNSSYAELRTNNFPIKIRVVENGFLVDFNTGEKSTFFSEIISTVHLNDLINLIEQSSLDTEFLKRQARKLMYRNLVLVNMVFDKDDVKTLKEHWIDVHDPKVKALRVTNFGNYEFGMNSNHNIGVGLEYNCFESCDIWNDSDTNILETAIRDLNTMKLANSRPVNYSIIRIPKAYPVYFKGYEEYTNNIFNELIKIQGLHLAGRNSLYKWNNMHHSVKTGILAAQNINGCNHNIFDVKGMVSIGKETD
jgi:protoporphyrinogen oxidase